MSRTKTPLAWLGGLTAEAFMRRHWQKKPLFVKGAFPDWRSNPPPVTAQEVLSLAKSSPLPARLVRPDRSLLHAPLRARDFPSRKTPGWTVLVQQINTALESADQFLGHFRFLPEARLDDLMISYASDTGGIGAHVDSYDVFLIQAEGQRQWEIACQFDPSLRPNEELKILSRFKAEQKWLCEPGDLLYLPPGVAHRGIAKGNDCLTYSVGFRSANPWDIADEGFALRQELQPEATSQSAKPDPWLQATDDPSRVPDRLMSALVAQAMAELPSRSELEQACLIKLSEPHPMAMLEAVPDLSLKSFATWLGKQSPLAMQPGARLIRWGNWLAANGETLLLEPGLAKSHELDGLLKTLCTERKLGKTSCISANRNSAVQEVLYWLYLQATFRV